MFHVYIYIFESCIYASIIVYEYITYCLFNIDVYINVYIYTYVHTYVHTGGWSAVDGDRSYSKLS